MTRASEIVADKEEENVIPTTQLNGACNPSRLDTWKGKESQDSRPSVQQWTDGFFIPGTACANPSFSRGGSGAEPLRRSLAPEAAPSPQSHGDELSRLEADLDETPKVQRYDEPLTPEPLKLETRGVTSQLTFWEAQSIHKESIVAKLNDHGRKDLAEPLSRCHSYQTAAVCVQCGKAKLFYNRCETFYCPQCQPRLSKERRQSVEWWTRLIKQPKHVVLTVRNSTTLTKGYVQRFKKNLSRLRRRKFARNWTGGFYSLEVTNEGRGWHLHAHLLIDARWIDGSELARQWADVVGQDYAIVKVKDARCQTYLKEVTKYAVKGSQLAAWTPADIITFIEAFQGVRTFGVFGSLYGKRTEWREFLETLQAQPPACECGCTRFKIMTPEEAEIYEPYHPTVARPPPTPIPDAQLDWLQAI